MLTSNTLLEDFMKKVFLILLCICMLLSVVACKNEEPAPSDPTPDTPAENPNDTSNDTPTDDNTPEDNTANTLDKDAWAAKFADEVFENYTVIFEGRMTVTENGAYDSTSDVWQKIQVTSDMMAITVQATEVDSPENSGTFTITLEGVEASVQKIQNSQLFLLILRDYDNFIYDATTNSYIIPQTITMQETLQALAGDNTFFPVLVRIEIREAIVTFSEDGKLATFTCDYTQTMIDFNVTTSGKTTWTFSDFGTTVISVDDN